MNDRFLAELPLFRGLDKAAIERLAQMCEERALRKDESLFRQGDAPDGLYVVMTGSIAVFRDTVGKPVQLIARKRTGDWFGEMGLVEDSPRSASARATEPSRLLRMPRASLLRFLDEHPTLALKLQFAAVQRHHENVTAALDLSTSKEVRMRIDREAELEVRGERKSVRIENLSLGGVSLSGAPDDWKVGQERDVALIFEKHRLEARVRVSWTSRSQTGVSFVATGDDHELEVLQMTRAMLASDRF